MTPVQRQRLLAIIAGAAVLLLVSDRVIFTPLIKAWDAHSAEITTLQKSITNGHSEIERADRTRTMWREMESNALPKDAAQAEQEVIAALDKWGHASGIDLG